jgi:recombination protein RecT
MEQLPATQNGNGSVGTLTTVKQILGGEAVRAEIEKSLRKRISVDSFTQAALLAVRKQPKLLECDSKSLCAALLDCAQYGLEPRGRYGCYLIPFSNSRSRTTEVQVIVDYLALKNKVIEAGAAKAITSAVVYRGDDFDFVLGDNPHLSHKPNFTAARADNDLTLAYAIATLPDGSRQYEVIARAEIDKTRSRSRAGNAGPWVSDYPAMAMKTAIRRLCKQLYTPTPLADLFAKDDEQEFGESSLPSSVVEIPRQKVITNGKAKRTEAVEQLPPVVNLWNEWCELRPTLSQEQLKEVLRLANAMDTPTEESPDSEIEAVLSAASTVMQGGR